MGEDPEDPIARRLAELDRIEKEAVERRLQELTSRGPSPVPNQDGIATMLSLLEASRSSSNDFMTAVTQLTKDNQAHSKELLDKVNLIANPKSTHVKSGLGWAFTGTALAAALVGAYLSLNIGNIDKDNTKLRETGAVLLTGAFTSLAGLLASSKF
jgi:hypothetical protein